MAEVSIDLSSIESAVNAEIGTSAGERVEWAIANGAIMQPEAIGAKFVEILQSTIASSGLSDGVISAISNIACEGVTNLGDGYVCIGISFTDDLFRFSLSPDVYGGIDNLAALYNYGVGHTMNEVIGYWHGELTGSRTVIPGAHFMESAVAQFMGLGIPGVIGVDILWES